MTTLMKDSGIDWIGEIPEEWKVKRLKDVLSFPKLSKAKENSPNYLEIGDVNINTNDYDISNKEKLSVDNAKQAKKGMLVISTVRPARGGITIIKEDCPISSAFCVVNIKGNKYWYYLIKNKLFLNQLSNLNTGVTYPTCKDKDIYNQSSCVPPLETQKKIADYLDVEVSLLDKQVSLLERKYALLGDYKDALIFETVTQGLDKAVPMKDSGIDWIGEIPEGWKVKRVKEVTKWKTGFTPSTKIQEYYNGDDEWATISDLDKDLKYIENTKNKINGKYFEGRNKIPKNSLLFSFKLSVGQVAFNKKEMYTNEAICSFLRSSSINLNYFYYAAPVFIIKNANKNIYGANILNQELISNALTLVPPLETQKKIAEYLDVEVEKLDKQRELIKRKVELLKEYKEALIFEVVTGKKEVK